MALHLQLFWRMARPAQLLAIVLVFSWGVLMALGQGPPFDPQRFGWGLAAALLISISIHYANEYADVETDRLSARTAFSGGSGALPDLGLAPSLALCGARLTLTLGFMVALAGFLLGGLNAAALPILALAALLGWGYSVAPLKLAWRGWGELDNAFLGGLLLPVYGYVLFARDLDVLVLGAILPFTLLTFTNLLATTWADKHADAQVGKFTLATRLLPRHLRALYGLVLVAAYFCIFSHAGYSTGLMLGNLVLALPISLWALRRYTRQRHPAPSVYAMVAFLLLQLVFLGAGRLA